MLKYKLLLFWDSRKSRKKSSWSILRRVQQQSDNNTAPNCIRDRVTLLLLTDYGKSLTKISKLGGCSLCSSLHLGRMHNLQSVTLPPVSKCIFAMSSSSQKVRERTNMDRSYRACANRDESVDVNGKSCQTQILETKEAAVPRQFSNSATGSIKKHFRQYCQRTCLEHQLLLSLKARLYFMEKYLLNRIIT